MSGIRARFLDVFAAVLTLVGLAWTAVCLADIPEPEGPTKLYDMICKSEGKCNDNLNLCTGKGSSGLDASYFACLKQDGSTTWGSFVKLDENKSYGFCISDPAAPPHSICVRYTTVWCSIISIYNNGDFGICNEKLCSWTIGKKDACAP